MATIRKENTIKNKDESQSEEMYQLKKVISPGHMKDSSINLIPKEKLVTAVQEESKTVTAYDSAVQ